jgi:hypothetical protein
VGVDSTNGGNLGLMGGMIWEGNFCSLEPAKQRDITNVQTKTQSKQAGPLMEMKRKIIQPSLDANRMFCNICESLEKELTIGFL